MPAKQDVLTTLDAVHFDAFLNGRQEPDWMLQSRREAWSAFEAAAAPYWRRSRLGGLRLEQLTPAAADVSINWSGDTAGVIVLSLADALAQHPDKVQKILGTGVQTERDRYTALNNAFVRDGVFVYVPKSTEVEAPIHVRYAVQKPGDLVGVRTLVYVERHSSVTVIEEFAASGIDGQALVLSGAELHVEDEAHVTFNSIQTLDTSVYNLGAQQINIAGKDARATWLNVVVGSAAQHVTLEAQLRGNGSGVEWNGLLYGSGTQNVLVAPKLNHIGLNTEGQINFKTVVDDAAYAVFDGMVRIPHSGQGTNSDLRENALHLSKDSRSDSIPGLEIDANEVKAGHGATSGQIDAEQLFYLMSRGLPREEAKRVIVIGFVGEIIDLIADETVRDRVLDIVTEKI